jgi:outer membrane protein OmpA-like peptidoglycan-associated protein
MPTLTLPFLLAACGSNLSSSPPRDASTYATTSSPHQTNVAPDDAKSAEISPSPSYANPYALVDAKSATADLGYTPPPQQHAKAAGSPRAPADGTSEDLFPERRAIEALEVLASTGQPVTLTPHGATITLQSDELFETGTATLKPNARWHLDDVALALASQTGRDITIRGYTDSLGSSAESRALSSSRAAAVRDYVVAKGAHAEQVRVEGLGPDHPVADNATALGRAANRRVEIVVTTRDTSYGTKSKKGG